jgi:hypothetical protein
MSLSVSSYVSMTTAKCNIFQAITVFNIYHHVQYLKKNPKSLPSKEKYYTLSISLSAERPTFIQTVHILLKGAKFGIKLSDCVN